MTGETGIFEQQFIEKLADALADRIARSPSTGTSKRLFTMTEAAEYIGRSPKAVERLIQRGAIPVTKIDGKRQVDRDVLDKIISDRTYFEV
jgi:excisionase family DNA binding protein